MVEQRVVHYKFPGVGHDTQRVMVVLLRALLSSIWPHLLQHGHLAHPCQHRSHNQGASYKRLRGDPRADIVRPGPVPSLHRCSICAAVWGIIQRADVSVAPAPDSWRHAGVQLRYVGGEHDGIEDGHPGGIQGTRSLGAKRGGYSQAQSESYRER